MKTTILISRRDVERLKREATRLKKSAGLPHHQALDRVASDVGFRDWHHVCQSAAEFAPTDDAHRTGLIIAYDQKEGSDFHDEEGLFVEDPNGFIACYRDLFESYSNYIDEDGRRRKDTVEPSDLKEDFREDFGGHLFFRYVGTELPETVDDVLAVVRERAFWMPEYIWLRGSFHSMWD